MDETTKNAAQSPAAEAHPAQPGTSPATADTAEESSQAKAYQRQERLVTGLLVSIFQAATQINEATLSFVPKLIIVFVTLIVAGPWMITMMTDYMQRLYGSIPNIIG